MAESDRPLLTRCAGYLGAEREELVPLAWAFAYFFCLLCGYSILRPVRDEIAIEGGLHNLPWMMSGTFLTMLCVTHEMGFARTVANRIIFMDRGEIVEQNEPKEFFANPRSERTRLFLSQILHH